jgi:hypothetical protein
MRCDRVLEVLPILAEKMLPAHDTAEVTEHLHACNPCDNAWRRHQAIEHFFLVGQAPELPESYWRNTRRRILEQVGTLSPSSPLPKPEPLPRFRGRFIAVGAAAAAVLLIAVITLLRGGQSQPPAPEIAKPNLPPLVEPEIVRQPEPEPEAPKREPEVVKDVPRPEPPKPEPKPAPEVVKDVPKPEPKPEPPKPEPRPEPPKDPVAKDPKPEPKPEPPKPEPKPEPAPVAKVILPGDEGYNAKLTADHIAALLAANEAEMAAVVLGSARARIDEIVYANEHRPEVVTELVDAYLALLAEGAGEVVTRKSDAQLKASLQAELTAQFKLLGGIKAAEPALSAIKAVGNFTAYRPTYRSRGALGVLGQARELGEIAGAKDFEARVLAAGTAADHRVLEIVKAIREAQEKALAEGVGNYEALLARGIVEAMTRAYNTGLDVANPKAKLIRSFKGAEDTLSRFIKSAPAALKANIQRAHDDAKAAREALARIPDGVNPNVKPTKPSDPAPPVKPPTKPKDPGKPDPGFDPNPPGSEPPKPPDPEKGFEPK